MYAIRSYYEIVIQTLQSYETLFNWTQKIIEEAEKNEGLTNLDTDLRLSTPQLTVKVARDKVEAMNIDLAAAGRTLETLLGGREVTRFKLDGEQYDVISYNFV